MVLSDKQYQKIFLIIAVYRNHDLLKVKIKMLESHKFKSERMNGECFLCKKLYPKNEIHHIFYLRKAQKSNFRLRAIISDNGLPNKKKSFWSTKTS